MKVRRLLLVTFLLAAATTAGAQTTTQNVEVEPLTCWWRANVTSVRIGQPFDIILTCSILEAEATRTVVDRTRLVPAAVQLPPYEVTSGRQSADVTVPGRRFVQYEYVVRLIEDDVFGSDVPVPPMNISYRIESRVQQSMSLQGREQIYAMPPLPMHITSLVPSTASHIREAPVSSLSSIAGRETRATLFRTIATLLFGVAALGLVVSFVTAFQRRRRAGPQVAVRLLSNGAVLRGVGRELDAVRRQSAREGWNDALAARALTALRISASYAGGQPVAQRVADSNALQDGQLSVSRAWRLRGPVYVSGAGTPLTLSNGDGSATAADLRSAINQLTTLRYGRTAEVEKVDLNDAIESGVRATKRLAADHSWFAELMRSARRSLSRRRVWTR
jgi:hypothetical protein